MRAFIALLLLTLLPDAALAACRQALALGLDVSGSVDSREYRLQLDGLATALESPRVAAHLLELPDAPVALAIYEWSGPDFQSLILPWTEITTAATLAQITALLRNHPRSAAPPPRRSAPRCSPATRFLSSGPIAGFARSISPAMARPIPAPARKPCPTRPQG